MIQKDNYQAYFLDYVEGSLTEEEKKELIVFLEKYPELKAEIEEYDGSTKLIPDESITFPKKEVLKRKQVSYTFLFKYAAVAASILLIFFMGTHYFSNNTPLEKTNNQISRNTSPVIVQKDYLEPVGKKLFSNPSSEPKKRTTKKNNIPKYQEKNQEFLSVETDTIEIILTDKLIQIIPDDSIEEAYIVEDLVKIIKDTHDYPILIPNKKTSIEEEKIENWVKLVEFLKSVVKKGVEIDFVETEKK